MNVIPITDDCHRSLDNIRNLDTIPFAFSGLWDVADNTIKTLAIRTDHSYLLQVSKQNCSVYVFTSIEYLNKFLHQLSVSPLATELFLFNAWKCILREGTEL